MKRLFYSVISASVLSVLSSGVHAQSAAALAKCPTYRSAATCNADALCTWASNNLCQAKPTGGGQGQPPAGGAKPPPTGGGQGQPPAGGAKPPPTGGGQGQPPAGGAKPPPTGGGQGQPPAGGAKPPPTGGGQGQPPAGAGAPPPPPKKP